LESKTDKKVITLVINIKLPLNKVSCVEPNALQSLISSNHHLSNSSGESHEVLVPLYPSNYHVDFFLASLNGTNKENLTMCVDIENMDIKKRLNISKDDIMNLISGNPEFPDSEGGMIVYACSKYFEAKLKKG